MMLPRQSEAAVEALQRTQEREGEEWQRNMASLYELTRFVAANVACYRYALLYFASSSSSALLLSLYVCLPSPPVPC